MRFTAKTRFSVVAALVALCLLLVLANIIKHGLLTWEELVRHKDALAAANSAVGIVVLCIGAILSYFRFFKGRTLSLRAELKLDIAVIEAPGERYLHAISLEVKNVGSATIWNPSPKIAAYTYTGENREFHSLTDQWDEPLQQDDGIQRIAVLDSGETSSFLSHKVFDRSVWAVTYMASVSCDSGDVWKRLATVENRPSKKSEDKDRKGESSPA